MEQNRFRCHFSMLFRHMGGVAVLVVLSFINHIGELLEEAENSDMTGWDMLLIIGMLMLICLVVFGYNLLVWRKTWIQIDGTSVVIERNTINRKVRTIGIQNISNVNLTQNLWQKLYGAYEVKFDTNSATTANETDVHIILGEKRAYWMRDEILRLSGKMTVEEQEAEAEIQTDTKEKLRIRYTWKDVLLHCVCGWSVFSILFLVGILAVLILGLHRAVTEDIVHEAADELGGVFALMLGLLGVGYKMIQAALRYYGFEVERKKNEIRVHYGLIQQKEYLIPVEKISAVRIKQSLIARIARRKSLEIICVGIGDDENEETAILLSAKEEVLYKQIEQILPEYASAVGTKRMSQPAAAWVAMLPGMVCMLLFVSGVTAIISDLSLEGGRYVVIGGIVVYIWYLLCKALGYSAKKAAVGETCVVIVTGIFQLRTLVIPYDKIQYLKISQGIIGRHFGLCRGEVHILASVAWSVHETGDFPERLLEEVHRKVL